jgi:hypothetical protein
MQMMHRQLVPFVIRAADLATMRAASIEEHR